MDLNKLNLKDAAVQVDKYIQILMISSSVFFGIIKFQIRSNRSNQIMQNVNIIFFSEQNIYVY